MRSRIFILFSIFIYFVLIFCLGKVAFTLINASLGGGVSFSELMQVLYHGLPLDFSMSGYLTALPALFLIASIWIRRKIVVTASNIYFAIILSIIAIITVVDIVVYPYWGFHFDSSVFLYLQKPKETFASASFLQLALGLVFTIAVAVAYYAAYNFTIKRCLAALSTPRHGWMLRTFIVLLVLTAALFLPIRGGVTVSTMNVGRAYFSDNMYLNHAAINPVFNLMYSFTKSEDFGSQYQFFDKQEAEDIFAQLNNDPQGDSIPQLLNTKRPNIILFMLESFSANAAKDSIVTPNMYRLMKEGVSFDNFYANSFRTDRGLVSIMSGYPAHPTVAIMKYPQKTQSLPTIPRALKDEGYDLSFYYGGDADFANMRSFFVGACAIKHVVSDKDFPISERMTKWGAPDSFLLDRVYNDLSTQDQTKEPFMKTVLTLSSHEPFDVPTRKFDEPFLNAVHYTDSCLGLFVDKLRATPLWDNTLLVFVADHAMQSYPANVNNYDPQRFHIPLVWAGGAVKAPKTVSHYGSQNDLAATLLSQLDIKHDAFRFSKDMLNPKANKFAFYSYVNGFSMTDSTGTVIYDNDQNMLLKQEGNPELEKKAKAFFQNMYIDLGDR